MIEELLKSLQPKLEVLLQHPVYKEIENPEHLNCFLEYQVYAEWARMSLLKKLQQHFTITSSPWFPPEASDLNHLINQIVLKEEAMIDLYGKHLNNFEIYLETMTRCGANTNKINGFLEHVKRGTDIFLVIATSELPVGIKYFLKNTFDIISEGSPHKIAAAFTFGREGWNFDLFSSRVQSIMHQFPEQDLKPFYSFIVRNKVQDLSNQRSPGYQLVEKICGNDKEKWNEALETSLTCLESKTSFLNGVMDEIREVVSVY